MSSTKDQTSNNIITEYALISFDKSNSIDCNPKAIGLFNNKEEAYAYACTDLIKNIESNIKSWSNTTISDNQQNVINLCHHVKEELSTYEERLNYLSTQCSFLFKDKLNIKYNILPIQKQKVQSPSIQDTLFKLSIRNFLDFFKSTDDEEDLGSSEDDEEDEEEVEELSEGEDESFDESDEEASKNQNETNDEKDLDEESEVDLEEEEVGDESEEEDEIDIEDDEGNEEGNDEDLPTSDTVRLDSDEDEIIEDDDVPTGIPESDEESEANSKRKSSTLDYESEDDEIDEDESDDDSVKKRRTC